MSLFMEFYNVENVLETDLHYLELDVTKNLQRLKTNTEPDQESILIYRLRSLCFQIDGMLEILDGTHGPVPKDTESIDYEWRLVNLRKQIQLNLKDKIAIPKPAVPNNIVVKSSSSLLN